MHAGANTKTADIPFAGSAVEAGGAGRASVWIYIVWLSLGVFEGPLRGGLSAAGVPNLLYLRDAVVAGAVGWAFVAPFFIRESSHPPGLVLMGWVLALHLCIGVLLSGTV